MTLNLKDKNGKIIKFEDGIWKITDCYVTIKDNDIKRMDKGTWEFIRGD